MPAKLQGDQLESYIVIGHIVDGHAFVDCLQQKQVLFMKQFIYDDAEIAIILNHH